MVIDNGMFRFEPAVLRRVPKNWANSTGFGCRHSRIQEVPLSTCASRSGIHIPRKELRFSEVSLGRVRKIKEVVRKPGIQNCSSSCDWWTKISVPANGGWTLLVKCCNHDICRKGCGLEPSIVERFGRGTEQDHHRPIIRARPRRSNPRFHWIQSALHLPIWTERSLQPRIMNGRPGTECLSRQRLKWAAALNNGASANR
jgi:hypothetical protein